MPSNIFKLNVLLFSTLLFLFFLTCSDDKSKNPTEIQSEDELIILSPSDNSVVSGTVKITSSVSGNLSIDEVEFYIDENLKFTSTSAPFEFNWTTQNYADSTYHIIQLKGYNCSELAATSNIITVRVINANVLPDRTPPTVSVTSPSNGAQISGTVNISVQASDDNGVKEVKIYIDSIYVSTSYNYDWNTANYSNGSHTIYARAWDYADNEGISSTITVTVNNQVTDRTPPTVSINYPSDGQELSGTVNIDVEASDNMGVKEVNIFIDGNYVSNSYSYDWNTANYSNGSHTIHAKAWDYSDNEGTSETIYVTVNNFQDNTPPTVTITYPIHNSTISGEIRVTGSAHDNDKLKRVYLYIDGRLKEYHSDLNTNSRNIYYDWNTNLELDDIHNIYIDATDHSGNQTISPPLIVTTQNSVGIGEDAILNGGFEQSNNSDFWKISLFGSFINDANIAHSGNYCFQGIIDGATSVTPFHIEKDQSFTLEFWAKGECDNIRFYLLYSKDNYSFSDCLEIIYTSNNSNDWNKFSADVLINKEVELAKIDFEIDNYLYIDDISFIRTK